jgi:S1-C subfamily serine protease
MKFIRKLHVRLALVALVVLIAVGTGAAYATTRAVKRAAIGTGVVVVNTNLAYQNGRAAGTGMVLSSTGEILTNNHVITGATTIKVVVPGTTHGYTARVVGYSVSKDVAVLQLQNASNLKTISAANSAALKLGARVTALGNAGGTGTLTSATGTVTGLARSITVQDDSGGTEQLSGLIETNAALQAGDSGGPLLNNAGQVVGMDTAGSVSGGGRFAAYAASDGFAIPIKTALAVAKQIEAGTASATVHVGATPFLGIGVESAQSAPFEATGASFGLAVVNVVSAGGAARAGLVTGDVITAVDGKAVSAQSDLQSILLAHRPGDRVTITYTDPGGSAHTTTATLGSGPPQ